MCFDGTIDFRILPNKELKRLIFWYLFKDYHLEGKSRTRSGGGLGFGYE